MDREAVRGFTRLMPNFAATASASAKKL